MNLYGGIETGGTKFVCAVGSDPDHIIELSQFPTTTPEETIGQAPSFFRRQPRSIQAVGIGSFGPVDLGTGSPTYGRITNTPKVGWQNVDIVGRVQSALKVLVGFDMDVNAAALGEHCWGAARYVDTFVYLTVGTGIGGGGMVQGKLLNGLSHPEISHIRPPHDWQQDPFEGICLYHKDCLEGLASGPAIQARWGARGETPAG